MEGSRMKDKSKQRLLRPYSGTPNPPSLCSLQPILSESPENDVEKLLFTDVTLGWEGFPSSENT